MNSEKLLKIAYIVRKYSTLGGTEKHIFLISKKLAELGHKIFIICSKKEVASPNSNIKIINLPCNFPNRILKTYLFYLLTKSINLNNYNVVQGAGKVVKHHIYRAGGGFHKLYLKFQKKRKKISIYDKIVLKIEKEIFNPNNTNFVISVSNFVAKEIVKEFNFPQDRIVVLHNCIDTNIFKPKEEIINNKILKCLFVANDYKLKGLENVLLALKNFKNFKLKVIGNDNPQYFKNLSHKLKINDKIEFLGSKKNEELVRLYQESDLLIHPTYYDPFSNVCLEAMACGVPVITTKLNGVSEIIDNFKDGVIIDSPENIKQLIEGIRFFENKENLYNSKINAVKKAKLYSVDKYVERLLEIYYNIGK